MPLKEVLVVIRYLVGRYKGTNLYDLQDKKRTKIGRDH